MAGFPLKILASLLGIRTVLKDLATKNPKVREIRPERSFGNALPARAKGEWLGSVERETTGVMGIGVTEWWSTVFQTHHPTP
jgi:hypothetical protein